MQRFSLLTLSIPQIATLEDLYCSIAAHCKVFRYQQASAQDV